LRRAEGWLRDYTDADGERPFAYPFYWSAFVLIGYGGSRNSARPDRPPVVSGGLDGDRSRLMFGAIGDRLAAGRPRGASGIRTRGDMLLVAVAAIGFGSLTFA
jgi:hypothetical protein